MHLPAPPGIVGKAGWLGGWGALWGPHGEDQL